MHNKNTFLNQITYPAFNESSDFHICNHDFVVTFTCTQLISMIFPTCLERTNIGYRELDLNLHRLHEHHDSTCLTFFAEIKLSSDNSLLKALIRLMAQGDNAVLKCVTCSWLSQTVKYSFSVFCNIRESDSRRQTIPKSEFAVCFPPLSSSSFSPSQLFSLWAFW